MAEITTPDRNAELDAVEEREWVESLDYVIKHGGPDRVRELLRSLQRRAAEFGILLPYSANTPYINTIPTGEQPRYPGHRAIERRIKSIIRWNAMAMVVRANRIEIGIGGHISTYASAATPSTRSVSTTSSVARTIPMTGATWIYFQGHAARPGIYARAFLEGPDDRGETRKLSPRVEARRRPGVVPASDG